MPAVALAAIFVASAAVIWAAGTRLARATDAIDARFGLGDAIGGMVLLGIVTSLPELAITVSAAAGGHTEVAVGNLLGGIGVQTIVLAALDASRRGSDPLSRAAASPELAIEAAMVVVVVAVAIMGAQLPAHVNVAGLSPASVAILLAWLGGLVAVGDIRRGRRSADRPRAEGPGHFVAFGICAVATLVAGVAIELAGDELARRAGLGGAVFGATFLAAATSLPELSTGIAAVRADDPGLAMSDIFGGNAFMPALFVVADLVAGRPALADAGPTDLWLAALGILLTAIYGAGVALRPERRRLRMGVDSRLVLCAYALGAAGLAIVR